MPLSLTTIDATTPPLVNLPSMSLEDSEEVEVMEEVEEEEDADGLYHLPDVALQRPDESLVTLSMEPRSKWQTLFDQDLIRARNKPKEAPKAPELAPFYLPTVAGVTPQFAEATAEEKEEEEEKSNVEVSLSTTQNELGALLWQCSTSGDCTLFFIRLARTDI